MSTATARFVGGPLDGEVRELESTRPITLTTLHSHTVSHFTSEQAPPLGEVGIEEFTYWLVPKRDGTWLAFEKSVWDEFSQMRDDYEERISRITYKAHEALDKWLRS